MCNQIWVFHIFLSLFETSEVKSEYCVRCKKRNFWRKDPEGRIDNQSYAEEHKRDYFKPGEKYFTKEYGQ